MSVRLGSITALLAALLLALAVQSAAGDDFTIDSSTLRLVIGEVAFAEANREGPTCPVTLEGTFPSPLIAKVWDSEIGEVTSASIGACTGGSRASVTFLTFPWRLKYESYWFALPEIEEIRVGIVGLGYKLRYPSGSECTYQAPTEGTPPEEAFLGVRPYFSLEREWIAGEGRIKHVELHDDYVYNTRGSGCLASGGFEFRERESITPRGSTSAIHVLTF